MRASTRARASSKPIDEVQLPLVAASKPETGKEQQDGSIPLPDRRGPIAGVNHAFDLVRSEVPWDRRAANARACE